MLAQQGISVTVIDASDTLDEQPRACHYGPAAKWELERAGVLAQITAEGFQPDGLSWRTHDGRRVAKLDFSSETESTIFRMVCLPLDRVLRILHDAAVAQGCEVLMQHRLTSEIGQSAAGAWVDVVLPSTKTKRLEADYVVGCDGASSQVRRALFGELDFPGKTWDQQIIASNAYYPFEKFGYDDVNFIIDQENWYMAAKISKDGLWRVTYGDMPGLTKQQYLERLPMRYKTLLPGQPEPTDFKVTNIGPYKMHQRLAPSFCKGRFVLAGDAAHLCNPFGGLGLTGGIADVGCLFDALVSIHTGLAGDGILDYYSTVRAHKYRTVTDPLSTSNFMRLWFKDPETTIAEDEFLGLLKKAEDDASLMRQIRQVSLHQQAAVKSLI
ncbi:hypothetical protein ACJ41O_012465 [Fusarium nematophilum]